MQYLLSTKRTNARDQMLWTSDMQAGLAKDNE